MGKVIGKCVIIIYILVFLMFQSLYIRYFGDRLVSSIYIGVDMKIFILVLLLIIGIVFRSGIQIVGRLNIILFGFIVVQFIIVMTLLLTKFSLENITLISLQDTVPVLKGLIIITSVLSYIFYVYTTFGIRLLLIKP